MLVPIERQIEGRADWFADQKYEVNGQLLTDEQYWLLTNPDPREDGKGLLIAGAVVSGIALLLGGAAATNLHLDFGAHNVFAADCDSGRFLTDHNGALALASDCEGIVYDFPNDINQQIASIRTVDLTQVLDSNYFMVSPGELRRILGPDQNTGYTRYSDSAVLRILNGDVQTPDGIDRLNALNAELTLEASQAIGEDVVLGGASLFYWEDRDTPNTLGQHNKANLTWLGVTDESVHITYNADGNPIQFEDRQTAFRPKGSGSPNKILVSVPSSDGRQDVDVEPSTEGSINISYDNPTTDRGVRPANEPVTEVLIDATVKSTGAKWKILATLEGFCGNLIEVVKVQIGELVKSETQPSETPTEIPTKTPTPKPAGQGGGGGGSAPAVPTEIVAPTQVIVSTAPAVPTERVAPTQVVVPTAPPPTAIPPTARPANTAIVAPTQGPVATRT